MYEETKSAVKNKGKGLIVMVNGNKVSVFGLDSRLSWIHTALGVPLADPTITAGGHGQPVSFEYIQKMNPD
ncbi:ABC transporter substrate-binding protein [[Haemophilus] felis]|nr:ABC transporter substrate-binding protein [[Haemophilus] felis]